MEPVPDHVPRAGSYTSALERYVDQLRPPPAPCPWAAMSPCDRGVRCPCCRSQLHVPLAGSYAPRCSRPSPSIPPPPAPCPRAATSPCDSACGAHVCRSHSTFRSPDRTAPRWSRTKPTPPGHQHLAEDSKVAVGPARGVLMLPVAVHPQLPDRTTPRCSSNHHIHQPPGP